MKEVDKYEGWTLEDHRVYQEKLRTHCAERRGAMAAMKQARQTELENIESLSSLDGFKVIDFDWDLFESDILKERVA
tara:strand:- start:568 stop:798 length:231 start_codon:yes stop_codon:yes gene_type:complete